MSFRFDHQLNKDRVAVRFGHCKIYCHPSKLNDVTAQLALQSNPFVKGDRASLPVRLEPGDVAAKICSVALHCQRSISEKFPDEHIDSLACALRKIRGGSASNQGMKPTVNKLKRLSDVASFLRHFSEGWSNGLLQDLQVLLSCCEQVASQCDARATYASSDGGQELNIGPVGVPPVPPPPSPDESLLNQAYTNCELMKQSQLLIASQNDFILSLSQHANTADIMLRSMSNALAYARESESATQRMLNGIQEKLDRRVEAIASFVNVGVQAAPEVYMRGVCARPRGIDVAVECDITDSCSASEHASVNSEEFSESESTSQFTSDDTMSCDDDSFSVSACVDRYIEITVEGAAKSFYATETFIRGDARILIAFDHNGGYYEFTESYLSDNFVRIVQDQGD